MSGRPPLELTDPTHVCNDVQAQGFRQTCLVALDHARVYLFIEKQNLSGVHSLQMGQSVDGGQTFLYTDLDDVPGSRVGGCAAWFEGWTPNFDGDGFQSNTKIHQFWSDEGGEFGYTNIDTDGDVWRAGANHGLIFPATWSSLLQVTGASVAMPNIAQTTDGDLHVVACDDNAVTAPQHWRSSDGGATWAYAIDAATPPFGGSVSADDVAIQPIGGNRLLFIWGRLSTGSYYSRVWDNNTDEWEDDVLEFATGYEIGDDTTGEPLSLLWIPKSDKLNRVIAFQGPANYDGVGDNGAWVPGSGYSTFELITMSDGTKVRIGFVAGGVPISFFVDTPSKKYFEAGAVLTHVSGGGGSGFSLTPGVNNIVSVELVLLSITRYPVNHLPFFSVPVWAFEINDGSWTQKTSPGFFGELFNDGRDFFGDNCLTYELDTGRVYCAYFRGANENVRDMHTLHYRTSDDFCLTWSSQKNTGSITDHLLRLNSGRYVVSDDGILGFFFGNHDGNQWFFVAADVLYEFLTGPLPLASAFVQVATGVVIANMVSAAVVDLANVKITGAVDAFAAETGIAGAEVLAIEIMRSDAADAMAFNAEIESVEVEVSVNRVESLS